MHRHILALCFFLAISAPAVAQKHPASADEAAAGRAALLQSLQRGKEITGPGGEVYRHLPEVKAVEGKDAVQGAVIETKGKIVLYRAAATGSVALDRNGKSMVYPTVVNPQTGTLGVLTGMLVVKPKNMSDADAIAGSYALDKDRVFAHLRTVFYKVRPGQDIADVSTALRADPRVESAYPEIIERVRQPR
jgi:hypothetical protein